MTPTPPPPSFSSPLRIALVGAPGTGKSTLLSHILTAWSPSPTPPVPTPQRPRPPFPFRLFSSRLGLFISNIVDASASLLRRNHARSHCNVVPFDGGVAYDPSGPCGSAAVRAQCDAVPDVVVLLCRLDGGRVSRADRLSIAEIVLCWGEDILERTMFVLSRGWATPVGGLEYDQYVRGRKDLLWRFVMEAVPPVQTGEEEEEEVQDGDEETPRREEVPHWVWVPAPEDEDEWFKVEGLETVEDNGSDDVSVSAVADDPIEVLYTAMDCAKDRNVYADPIRPPMLVVEMAEMCPRNESGDKILPDGRVWLTEVLEKILEIGARAKKQQAGVEAERPQRKGFWGTLGDMVKSLSRDGLRVLVAEIVIVALCLNIGSALKKRKERMLEDVKNEDVLLELNDADFERLNKLTTERIILAYKNSPDEDKGKKRITREQREEERKASEEELRRAIDEEMERRKNEGSPPNPSIEQLEKELPKL